MIQVIKEKIFSFKVGQTVHIDNMKFKIKEMYVQLDKNDLCSVTIWGNRPHATTISTERIVRLDDLLWKPRSIDIFTEKEAIISPFSKDKDLKAFVELQKTKKDKVVAISVEMDTMLNSLIIYDFD
jgi:hypothetical protein